MSVPRLPARPATGLTMLELLVVVAIVAIVVGIGMPSLRDWQISQRVVSTAGEVVTDLRFGRTDAISSNNFVVIRFRDEGKGCYTIFRSPHEFPPLTACDCTKGAGAACDSPFTELKTYAPPADGEVAIKSVAAMYEVYRPGGRVDTESADFSGVDLRVTAAGGKELKVVTTVGLPRPMICKPAGSKISGFKPCS